MDKEELKQIAAETAVEEVQCGMIIGLGTGSTVYHALLALGERVRDGLDIVGVPTSMGTEEISTKQGIPLSTLSEHPVVDLTIDGADEVDSQLNLIKGGGGAFLREKIVAHASERLIIVVDESKLVPVLGTTSHLAVEVVQFEWEATQLAINQICRGSRRRLDGQEPLISDNGNYILDCDFDRIPHPAGTESELNTIPGVVENGLFVCRADKAIIATTSGVEIKERSNCEALPSTLANIGRG